MPHTYFFGSTIFIQHEGPLNWAYLNSSKKRGSQPQRPIYISVNHISQQHDLFNTVAYRLGMTNMLAHPDFFLPGTGKKKNLANFSVWVTHPSSSAESWEVERGQEPTPPFDLSILKTRYFVETKIELITEWSHRKSGSQVGSNLSSRCSSSLNRNVSSNL